jgi:hypothetical protein
MFMRLPRIFGKVCVTLCVHCVTHKILWVEELTDYPVQRNPDDIEVNPAAGDQVFEAAKKKYGESRVRRDYYQKGQAADFPVKAPQSFPKRLEYKLLLDCFEIIRI